MVVWAVMGVVPCNLGVIWLESFPVFSQAASQQTKTGCKIEATVISIKDETVFNRPSVARAVLQTSPFLRETVPSQTSDIGENALSVLAH